MKKENEDKKLEKVPLFIIYKQGERVGVRYNNKDMNIHDSLMLMSYLEMSKDQVKRDIEKVIYKEK